MAFFMGCFNYLGYFHKSQVKAKGFQPRTDQDDYSAGEHHQGELHGLSHSHVFPKPGAVPHWDYAPDSEHGPYNWGSLCKEYSIARAGLQQSPIDLFSHDLVKADRTLHPLKFDYKPVRGWIENNGHSVQLNMRPGTLTVEGVTYCMSQLHFHSPSEHTLNGKSYPLEMHLVHQSTDGELAVIGMLFENGSENEFLQQFWDALPHKVGQKQKLSSAVDLNSLCMENVHYMRYTGSLTTPPCSENVIWTMLGHVHEVSPQQVAQFRDAMGFKIQTHGNARPLQPLGQRVVQTYK
jgi:carbonic anhydrase